MRVLFVVFPATAHLFPVVPLAWALQAAGHEVRVAAHAGVNEPDMAGTITATGLTPVPLGDRFELPDLLRVSAAAAGRERPSLALDPGGRDWETTRGHLLGLLSLYYPRPAAGAWPMADELVRVARSWRPDLVVWDQLCPTAPFAARAAGARHIRLLWGLDNLGWMRELARRHGTPAGAEPLGAWLRPLAERYGDTVDEEVYSGQWTLDLVPNRMRLPLDQRVLSVRRVPYNGAAPVPEWLRTPPRRPRVVLTLGVSSRRLAGEHDGLSVPALLEVVAGTDAEFVATLDAGQLAGVRALPPNVRVVDYLPLNQVLPGCAAIVHHGGGGTFAAAVAHRVPQLIVAVPKWDEQHTARYVADRGAGLALPGTAGPGELHGALGRLLTEPSFRAGAGELHRDMLAAPGPADVVPLLERFATAETDNRSSRARTHDDKPRVNTSGTADPAGVGAAGSRA